jgi:anaerobic magnesium-protoporphyrin IX monomethyl ester cyclase
MALSAYAKRFGYCDIALLNGQTPRGLSDAQITSHLRASPPAVVGITTQTMLWYEVARLARLVKRTLPTTKVVLGGPHLTHFGRETVAQDAVDFGIIGEGESTFLELLRTLEGKRALASVAGLVWKRGSEVVVNPARTTFEPLDDLPSPDHSLYDLRQHRIPFDECSPTGIIISSRGCPHHCAFCSRNYPYYRMRSAENVVAEMQAYKEMGYRAVTFYDDTFNASRQRVLEICHLLQERHVHLPWSFRARVDQLDEATARAAAEAGCRRVYLGVESGVQRVLDRVRKGITVEQIRSAFSACRRNGLTTVAYVVLGLPDETRRDAEQSLALIRGIDPDYVVYQTLLPVPGSPIYEEALAARAFPDYWREYARDPRPEMSARLWETGMRQDEVFRVMMQGLAEFYFRPRYVLRRLMQVRSLEDLATKSAMGVRLLGRMARGLVH